MLSSSTTNQSNCSRFSYKALKVIYLELESHLQALFLIANKLGRNPPPPKKCQIRRIMQPLMYAWRVRMIYSKEATCTCTYCWKSQRIIYYTSCICQYTFNYSIIIKYFFLTFWGRIFISHKWKWNGARTTSDQKDNTMPNVQNQKNRTNVPWAVKNYL